MINEGDSLLINELKVMLLRLDVLEKEIEILNKDYDTIEKRRSDMNLKINLQEDEELRKYIKDLIRGQVLSIAREEIKNILSELVDKKILPKTKKDIDDKIKSVVEEKIAKFQIRYYEYKEEFMKIFKEQMYKQVRREIKEYEKIRKKEE